MTFDFAECFTKSARVVAPRLLMRGLALAFDTDPPILEVRGNEQVASRSLHRLAFAVGELVDAGLLSFASGVDEGGFPSVRILGAGSLASTERASAALSRLGLSDQGHRGSLTVFAGLCPIAGATISVTYDEKEGFVVDANMPFEWTGRATPALPTAGGAAAWIRLPAHPAPGVFRRRLDRFGWTTRTFEAATALQQCAASLQAGDQPRMIIAREWQATHLQGLAEWMNLPYPADTIRVAIVPLGSPMLETHPPGWRIYPLPLSPRELIRITAEAQVSYDVDSLVGALAEPAPNRRILIVDDNDINQAVMTAMAAAMGYDAVQAGDGEQAVASCLNEAPAAVLMDVNMPVMDGIEATQAIRRLQHQGKIPPFPIIGASADATDVNRLESLKAGMDAFMAKPILIGEVAAHLRRLCVPPPVAGGW